jgi:hypothetical protein
VIGGLIRGCLLTALLAAAWGAAVASAPIPAGDEAMQAAQPLLDRALDASGVPEGEARDALTARFVERVLPLARTARESRSDLGAARRLHRLLHKSLFQKFSFDVPGIPELLERGEFNCVTAALAEGIAMRWLGIEARVVEAPGHVFLRLRIGEREVEVEAISKQGFDRRWLGGRSRGFLLAYKLATPAELAADPAAAVDAYRQVRAPEDLEAAPTFLRYNRAARALDRGEAAEAARLLALAVAERPAFREHSDEIGVAFARAFRAAYDEKRFVEAWEIARLDLETLPGRASAEDRLVAAAAKRIEALSDGGRPAEAEDLLDQVRREHPELASRLDRAACPSAALAAVREGDFERAQRLALRFEASIPGVGAGSSLLAWVRSRRPMGRTGAPPGEAGIH